MYAGLRKRKTAREPEFVRQALDQALIFTLILITLAVVCVLLLQAAASA